MSGQGPVDPGMSASETAYGTLIVGAGLAGVTLARQLRHEGYQSSVMVLGDEKHAPYDRPPLSKGILSAAVGEHQIGLLEPGEADRLGIEIRPVVKAEALDLDRRVVELASGDELRFNNCVIATGSRARRLSQIPERPGIFYLRSLTDSLALRSALDQAHNVAVVGAGFIGLEVASVAIERGQLVTVLEREALPLTRVLGPNAGQVVLELHIAHGVDLRCGTSLETVLSHPSKDGGPEIVDAVVLTDGSTIPADLVLIGAGAVPNVEWLESSGVAVDNGVVCDANGRSSADGVWAVGDVARWPNSVTGLHARMEQWQSALEQARIVAHNIVNPDGMKEWDTVPYFWSDQFGTTIQFCGHPGEHSRVMSGSSGPVIAFGSEDRLTGVLTIAQPRLLARARRLVAARATWAEFSELVSG